MKKFLSMLVVLTAFTGSVMMTNAAPGSKLVSQKAPEVSADKWINSKPLTLAGLKGKVVVVEFWATWCPPCRKSIPHLIEMSKHFGDKVTIIGCTQESLDEVQDFVKEQGMKYPIAVGCKSSGQYGVSGIPHAFVIGKDGKIAWEGHPMSGLDKAIEAAIK